MSSSARRGRTAIGFVVSGVVIVAVVIVLVVTLRHSKPDQEVTTAPSTPATHSTTLPTAATQPREQARHAPQATTMTYGQVVRANVPSLPTTEPLVVPLDLPQAAHLVLKDPLFIDARRNLWLTRSEAPPTEKVLAYVNPETEYVVPERVLFVHWGPDEDDVITPQLIVPNRSASAGSSAFEIVTAKMRKPIGSGRDYQWGRAQSWFDRILVPSATGVSVFHFDRQAGAAGTVVVEEYQDLMGAPGDIAHPASGPATAAVDTPGASAATHPAAAPLPQLVYDGDGFLAWIPWQNGTPGGRGAARYVDGHWIVLGAEQGWPEHILHLIPLLGGSVMQLVALEGETVKLGVSELGGAEKVDRKVIEKLVDDLSSAAPEVRDAAFAKLTRYGPAVRGILRELIDDQPPEGQARLRQLLKEQVQPLLGPMTLLGNQLRVVSRHADGGVVLYAEMGVSLATPDGEPANVVPAWLAIRPGKAVQVLPEGLVRDLKPETAQVLAVPGHDDDWVVEDGVDLPRRYFGNGFMTLLRKSEAAYTDLLGVDRRGRWFFRQSGESSAGSHVEPTLVLDPTFPDATPRLPVWNYTTADEVGWDKDNWPLVRQSGALFRLTEDGWQGIDKDDEFLNRPDQIPPPAVNAPSTRPAANTQPTQPTTRPAVAVSTTRSTSQPTTTTIAATTQPAAGDVIERLGKPIAVAPDGTRYFGGIENVVVISTDGRETSWPLPAIASGKPPVTLIRTADGTLFLFNEPGRVLRIKPTPNATEPFTVEATFTRNIPSADSPTRIWLDPAGRIVMALDKSLAILFPAGYIPPRLREKMADPDEAEGIER